MTAASTVNPHVVRRLKEVWQMELCGNGADPAAPFIRSLDMLHKQRLVSLKLEKVNGKFWCKPGLTPAGRELLGEQKAGF